MALKRIVLRDFVIISELELDLERGFKNSCFESHKILPPTGSVVRRPLGRRIDRRILSGRDREQ